MLFDLKSGFSLQFVDSTMVKIKGTQKLMRPVFAVLISLFQPNCDPMLRRIAANVQRVISVIDFEDTGVIRHIVPLPVKKKSEPCIFLNIVNLKMEESREILSYMYTRRHVQECSLQCLL